MEARCIHSCLRFVGFYAEVENQREKTITRKGKRENTFSNFRLAEI